MAVVGLQAALGLGLHKRARLVPGVARFAQQLRDFADAPRLYPFLDYPMYSKPHFEGESVPRFSLYAVLPDASEVSMDHRTLRMSIFLWSDALRRALQGDRAMLLEIADEWSRRSGLEPTALRIVNEPVFLRRGGLEYAHAETAMLLTLGARGGPGR